MLKLKGIDYKVLKMSQAWNCSPPQNPRWQPNQPQNLHYFVVTIPVSSLFLAVSVSGIKPGGTVK
jgi:hypothetical protein